MDRNFFNVNSINKIKQNQQNLFDEKPSNRLNGYDSGILNQNTPENEKMPFEFHITEKRNELTDVNGKIKNAEQYGTQSEVLGLKGRKQRLEKELFELNKEQFLNKYSKKEIQNNSNKNLITKTQEFISKKILPKVSKKFNSMISLGESLETLNSINQNVDTLLETNIPYGESKMNYEKLTEYLNKANKIQLQITKTMKNIS